MGRFRSWFPGSGGSGGSGRRPGRAGLLAVGLVVLVAIPTAVLTDSVRAEPVLADSFDNGLSPDAATDAWAPPAALAPALARVREHVTEEHNIPGTFRNYLWDQIMANKGYLNYCVRWESTTPVSADLRDKVAAQIQRQAQQWADAMSDNGKGWNGWPYPTLRTEVVGWAVAERSTLEWTDTSVPIYVGDLDPDGAPQCPQPCSRFVHQDGDYSGCAGGPALHFDVSLWVTDGFAGGAGGDWGQRIATGIVLRGIDEAHEPYLLHEFGHGLGLDDFYDWDPGVGKFVMNAAPLDSVQIEEFDAWMARDVWRQLKGRYGL